MKRTEFLNFGAAGAAGLGPRRPAQSPPSGREQDRPRLPDRSLSIVTGTHEDHRRRLHFIEECRRTIPKCMRQQNVTHGPRR